MTPQTISISASTVPETASAASLIAPQQIAINRVHRPQPKNHEVLVRIEGCGVCASNVPPWEGREWFEYPMPPGHLGHEGWGVIKECGDGVTGLRCGDRVAMLSHNAYAEYDVAPEDCCVKLPAELEGLPVPGEPLGCAMNIFGRADVQPGQTVAVVGIGFLGALLVQLSKRAGARVIAISRRDYSLQIAQQMGADETVSISRADDAIASVASLTGGTGGFEVRGFCDRVFECTGKAEPLWIAGECCGVRGRLIVAGFHQDGPRQIDLQSWNWRGLDVINAHERNPQRYIHGIRLAVDAWVGGEMDPTPLFTHRLPLHRLDDALRMTRDRPAGFIKAIVTP